MVEQYSQKLIVVRHAEPDRVTGHLTENGKSQAKTFAYRLGVIAPESTQLLTEMPIDRRNSQYNRQYLKMVSIVSHDFPPSSTRNMLNQVNLTKKQP